MGLGARRVEAWQDWVCELRFFFFAFFTQRGPALCCCASAWTAARAAMADPGASKLDSFMALRERTRARRARGKAPAVCVARPRWPRAGTPRPSPSPPSSHTTHTHTPANSSAPLGRSPSARGLRADHLMNFRAASRSDPPPRRAGRDPGPPRRQQAPAAAPPLRRPGDDRARHLGAPGLRFLVSDAASTPPPPPPRPPRGGLATALAAAATSAVPDWDDVAAVVVDVFPGLPPSCPITLCDLDTPSSAPVLTPCGHAFAAAALAAHIAARGGGAAPCPLCYARVGATDARALLLRHAAPVPAEGDAATDFVLVRRPRKGGRVAVVEGGEGGRRPVSV